MTVNKAITAVADNLKSHPLAFAIIVVNVLFLSAGVWILRDVATNARQRDSLLSQIVRDCAIKKPEQRDGR